MPDIQELETNPDLQWTDHADCSEAVIDELRTLCRLLNIVWNETLPFESVKLIVEAVKALQGAKANVNPFQQYVEEKQKQAKQAQYEMRPEDWKRIQEELVKGQYEERKRQQYQNQAQSPEYVQKFLQNMSERW